MSDEPASLPSGGDVDGLPLDELERLEREMAAEPWTAQPYDDGDGGIAIIGGNLGGLVAWASMWPTELDANNQRRAQRVAEFILLLRNNAKALIAAARTLTAREGEIAALKAALELERWGIDEIGNGLSSEKHYDVARMVIDRRAALEGKP